MVEAERSAPLAAARGERRAPTVDVVMTCCNEGEYIGEAVRSVLEQTAADRIGRILIVDSGSDQRTRDVLAQIEPWDPRIVIAYRGPCWVAANRNFGVAECEGDYVAFLDSDDAWELEKLAEQLRVLDAQPDIGVVYTGYFAFRGKQLSRAFPRKVADLDGKRDLPCALFLSESPISPSTVIVRRAVFQRIGGFDERVEVFEDTEFFLRAAQVCGFKALPQPLIFKRYHERSITANRGSLLPHNAFVALRAATLNERLFPLVPRHLSRRVRKLANVHYYTGDVQLARRLYGLAARLDPLSFMAWAGLALSTIGGGYTRGLLKVWLRRREAIFRPSGATAQDAGAERGEAGAAMR
jgi:glycosyltransferase involved in cell wall biosynthesis